MTVRTCIPTTLTHLMVIAQSQYVLAFIVTGPYYRVCLRPKSTFVTNVHICDPRNRCRVGTLLYEHLSTPESDRASDYVQREERDVQTDLLSPLRSVALHPACCLIVQQARAHPESCCKNLHRARCKRHRPAVNVKLGLRSYACLGLVCSAIALPEGDKALCPDCPPLCPVGGNFLRIILPRQGPLPSWRAIGLFTRPRRCCEYHSERS